MKQGGEEPHGQTARWRDRMGRLQARLLRLVPCSRHRCEPHWQRPLEGQAQASSGAKDSQGFPTLLEKIIFTTGAPRTAVCRRAATGRKQRGRGRERGRGGLPISKNANEVRAALATKLNQIKPP